MVAAHSVFSGGQQADRLIGQRISWEWSGMILAQENLRGMSRSSTLTDCPREEEKEMLVFAANDKSKKGEEKSWEAAFF